jgi:hypothetical protein
VAEGGGVAGECVAKCKDGHLRLCAINTYWSSRFSISSRIALNNTRDNGWFSGTDRDSDEVCESKKD